MKIDRLNLLARVGALQFAEEPVTGGGGSSNDDGQEGTSQEGADGDKSSGDSEDDSEDDEDEAPEGKGDEDDKDKDGADGFTPITSQAELNKVIGKRIERERAKFADYDTLKSENARLKEDLNKERHGSTLRKVSEDTGVPEGLLRGKTEEELRAHADEILSFTGGRPKKRKAGHSPHTGTGSERPVKPSTDTGRERARATAK